MLKTAALQLYHPHSSQNTGDILINLPFVDNQTLSALITVDTNSESSQEFVNSFLQLLKELSLELEIKTSNQPLEKLLGELNARLPRLPKASHFLTQLNCALAWQNQPEVHFTACGRLKIFLIKETTIKEIHLEKSDGQVFQQILQGNLQEKDSLLFTSYSLMDYISQDKIKKTITTLPLTGAMAYLENILSKAPQKSCFWALAIKASEKEVNSPSISPAVPKIVSQQAPSSLDRLLSTKKSTAAILDSPTFAEFSKEQANRFLAKIKGKILPKLWYLFKTGSKDYGLVLFQGLKFIVKLANYRNWPRLKGQWKKFWQETISHWQNFGRLQKIALLLIVIILTILTQSVKWQTKFLVTGQADSQWEQTIASVEATLGKIQAALIYNDKKAVVDLLASIDPALQNTPPLALQNKVSQLKKQVAAIQNKVWKVNQVKESVWLDLQALKQPLTPLRLIASSDQRIYLIAKEKQMYIFDTNANGEQLPPKLSENFPFLPTLTAPIVSTKSFIGITSDRKGYLVKDLGQSIYGFQELIWTTNQLKQPQALAYYNNRLYVADNNHQVLRYTVSGKNLAEETSWLKNPMSEDIKEFGIDGDLYLLTKQGLLEKYNRGQKTNWSTEPIDINLSQANLWVSQTYNQLYIFDHASGRLATFEKNGQLTGQITNSLLTQALDWTILEKNKLLLITTADKIYSFKLP